MKPVISALLLVSSVTVLAFFALRPHGKALPAPPVSRASNPASVPASEISLPTLPCRITARATITAGTLANGNVSQVLVKVGDFVTDGQVLATLSQPSAPEREPAALLPSAEFAESVGQARRQAAALQASVTTARASLARAESLFTKQELLNREGATPRLVYEAAKTERDRAATELAQMEESSRSADNAVAKLEDEQRQRLAAQHERGQAAIHAASAEIHAPAGGLLVESNINPGAAVTDANRGTLFRIAPHPEWLQAEFDKPVSPGRSIALHAGDTILMATVGESGKSADFESRTVPVRPGAPCSVVLQ